MKDLKTLMDILKNPLVLFAAFLLLLFFSRITSKLLELMAEILYTAEITDNPIYFLLIDLVSILMTIMSVIGLIRLVITCQWGYAFLVLLGYTWWVFLALVYHERYYW